MESTGETSVHRGEVAVASISNLADDGGYNVTYGEMCYDAKLK